LFTKPLIFVVISVLVVTLVFSSFSWFEAFAEPKDPKWGRAGNECSTDNTGTHTECCWINEAHDVVCQLCLTDVVATGADCGPVHTIRTLPPELEGLTMSPSPTPPPSGGKRLFGSDVPTLSISPDTGSTNDGGKVAEQPPAIPTAPTTPPTVLSPEETDQGDGDKKPPLVNDLPDIDITEQPEVQQQEEGEQPSNEGQVPAGPLT
jgi:hypothetical protein